MPIDPALVVTGLGALGLALQRPQPAETLALYARLIAPRVEAAAWSEAIEAWCTGGEWDFFPGVPAILAAYQARQDAAEGRRPVEVEAVDAYTRVLSSATYLPESGAVWTYRRVSEVCGKAAAEAWLAAGGHEAFASVYRADDRRRAFLAAYVETVRERPEARLLPWEAPVAALPAAEEPTRDDAAKVLRRLEPTVKRTVRPKVEIVDLDKHADRLARLRQQADMLREGK